MTFEEYKSGLVSKFKNEGFLEIDLIGGGFSVVKQTEFVKNEVVSGGFLKNGKPITKTIKTTIQIHQNPPRGIYKLEELIKLDPIEFRDANGKFRGREAQFGGYTIKTVTTQDFFDAPVSLGGPWKFLKLVRIEKFEGHRILYYTIDQEFMDGKYLYMPGVEYQYFDSYSSNIDLKDWLE